MNPADEVHEFETDEVDDVETDELAGPDEVGEEAGNDGGERRVAQRRPDLVLVVGIVLALALAAYAIVLGVGGRSSDDQEAAPRVGLAAMFDDDRAQAAVDVASEQIRSLLTLDPTTVDATLETLTERTTGDFRRQFEALVQTFGSVVSKGDVTTKGEINGAGLISLQEDLASVLVASSATVTNTQSTTPTPRSYRMRVDLQWVDGTWLVSGIEFVSGKDQP